MKCNATQQKCIFHAHALTLLRSNYTHLTHVYLFEWMNKIKWTIGKKRATRITCTSTITTPTATETKMQKTFTVDSFSVAHR